MAQMKRSWHFVRPLFLKTWKHKYLFCDSWNAKLLFVNSWWDPSLPPLYLALWIRTKFPRSFWNADHADCRLHGYNMCSFMFSLNILCIHRTLNSVVLISANIEIKPLLCTTSALPKNQGISCTEIYSTSAILWWVQIQLLTFFHCPACPFLFIVFLF